MAAFVDRLELLYLDGRHFSVHGYFDSLDEIAIWRAEFIQLGFSIVELRNYVEVGDSVSHHSRMPVSDSRNPPPGYHSEPAAFAWWFAVREVERLRALREFMRCQQGNGAPVESHNEGSGI